MAQIQVIGAGECGLPLALRLLRGGHELTLVTDRDADAVLAGTVTSTQVKFARTVALESAAGLDHWASTAPAIAGIRFTMAVDRTAVAGWAGRFTTGPARSVDQRTVFARWLGDVEAEGGRVEIADLPLTELDRRAGAQDLTVVARASRELAACFPADTTLTLPNQPVRRLAALYLDGVEPDPEGLGMYVALPGLGEVVSTAALTGAPGRERRCHTLMFEAHPGGGLDVFDAAGTPAERLRTALDLLDRHFPAALAARFRDAELTDAGATIAGAVIPALRHPVGTLPSGQPVLGGGDVVCRMDPGGAQGANSAAQCAAYYAAAVLDSPGDGFDATWMAAAAKPWLTDIARPAALWTMTLLDPPAALQKLMDAAQYDSRLADLFAETFIVPANMSQLAAALS
ncbi:styrene monooxygenase/indole monooxygenase family protein [Nocardia cyriacigeorgica]|uniref:styrene monooxygenase/indole monooxygenase family protein n=1 Tax=Nocardia cyriacigeorgica TaxID=135487 RepID=UPI0013D8D5ED|nr:styrene monooxygenase/indole monooxygenase family protein [Nocardia cyriacigeorgica]MBF6439136.1 FAD-binding oxidoreductase [Nocardia cyriacigeorgica]MBF6455393.1 FAD-binding oxidoreductase [Nocardia cyriacigeorgica]MBF6481182.1 FAD-binding oxidoreductase [Nocardia cyriacigeorgica]MBF6553865.1 FAD-binding oxidoreductase [Nocardia cyriacigeorgica]NEW29440.1 FAD-binding oxidoreductase [Nocardia cyriacigeorgica]